MGAEALLRWQHPSRGLLGPLEFLELAEEIGLGPALGDWVFHAALSQSAHWRGQDGRPIPVAINLANSQFRSPSLLERVLQAIATAGLETSQVEVEITETVALRHQLADTGLLAGFKEHGIRTAIDDFGTGQSALASLRQLRVDALKIDRSFVRDLVEDPRDRAIASCIVDMSHFLGMTVIAEGVETPGQLEVLRAMGCDQAQGFLFSRAVSAAGFARLLEDATIGQILSGPARPIALSEKESVRFTAVARGGHVLS